MLTLLSKFVVVRWKSRTRYPVSFILGIVGQWVSYGLEFASMWIVLSSFELLGEWLPHQVMALYSLNLCCYAGGASIAYGASRSLPIMVKDGIIDELIIKPLNSLIYLMLSNISISYISHFTLGVFGVVLSWIIQGIHFSISNLLLLILFILSGSVIHASLMILSAIPSIKMVGNISLTAFYTQVREFMYYPLSIFSKPLQFLFTFIIPCAFISFYPTSLMFEISADNFTGGWIAFFSPVVATLLAVITLSVWKITIAAYQSSGN